MRAVKLWLARARSKCSGVVRSAFAWPARTWATPSSLPVALEEVSGGRNGPALPLLAPEASLLAGAGTALVDTFGLDADCEQRAVARARIAAPNHRLVLDALHRQKPVSHSALDIKTLAMALLGSGYRDATKRNMPACWFDPLPHTHKALDDALEQGALFCNILAELRARGL
jgi:hypothetical protein